MVRNRCLVLDREGEAPVEPKVTNDTQAQQEFRPPSSISGLFLKSASEESCRTQDTFDNGILHFVQDDIVAWYSFISDDEAQTESQDYERYLAVRREPHPPHFLSQLVLFVILYNHF